MHGGIGHDYLVHVLRVNTDNTSELSSKDGIGLCLQLYFRKRCTGSFVESLYRCNYDEFLSLLLHLIKAGKGATKYVNYAELGLELLKSVDLYPSKSDHGYRNASALYQHPSTKGIMLFLCMRRLFHSKCNLALTDN